ncbi:MAG TPA: FtsX-like permease family protein [Gammaproteobacteria bacterium]|nr:FtsX-like permease family protein [Gammaproteobacteria bacterium]
MFGHYVAVALRNIRTSPFTSAVNVLTLAVGLVCFVTAYAAGTFWSSAEQHFRNVDDIHVLTLSIKSRDTGSGSAPRQQVRNATYAPDVAAEALKSDFPSIAKIARAVTIDRKTMVANGSNAVRLYGVAVDPEFLDIFDLPFIAGDSHSALSLPRSVVLTRDAATRLFGADTPIGKTLVIGNAVDATVTGVIDAIPEPSQFGRSANAQLPFELLASRDVYDAISTGPFGLPRGAGSLPPGMGWFLIGTVVYVYLPPEGGLSAQELSRQLGDFAARHVPAQMMLGQEYNFGLLPVREMLGGNARDFFSTGLSFAAVLLVLGGLVLGVACVNYANLATARAARRVREIGVRKALGAAPSQIAMQSLFEAAALTIAALVVALAVFALARPLVKDLLGAELGAVFFSRLDVWPALGALVLVVTLAAGAYPAFVLSRVRPVSAIAAAQARLGSPLFSTLLVGAQFAIASFLLIALTVITLQNNEMRRTALSGITDPLVVIENPASQTKVASATLRERLSAVPQVRAVTEVLGAPWEFFLIFEVASSPDPMAPKHSSSVQQVGFDFFDVFSVPLLAGRVFDRGHAEDVPGTGPAFGPRPPANPTGESPPPQNVIVDRAFVAALGLGTPEEAVGKLVYRPAPPGAAAAAPPPLPPMRIIGVVENRAFSFFKTPTETAGVMYTLQADLGVTIARVAAADLDKGLAGIDAAWKQLAPNVALSRRFLDEIFDRAYANYVRINHLFGTLSVMAFAICIAGLFGMAVFIAGRRRREIGVRKTLGGTTTQMIALLLAGFSRPVLIANVIAWPAGYFAARKYLSQFAQSIPITPWPFLLSVAITIAIAWLAVVGQTLRAARTTPAEVLRNE